MKNCIGKELSKIPMPVSFWHGRLLPAGPPLPGLGGNSGALTALQTHVAVCGVVFVTLSIINYSLK